jgi:predicted secreted protein
MNITAGLVLFSVTWFMVFFCVLPLRFVSQAEAGTVVPGTPRSAPADAQIKAKARLTTIITVVLFAIMASIILWGGLTIHDIDFMGFMDATAP